MQQKTPRVYVKDVSPPRPSVQDLATAVPAFIGYTGQALDTQGNSLHLIPTKVRNLDEYVSFFGQGFQVQEIFIAFPPTGGEVLSGIEVQNSYYLFESLQLYFANGGGDCYIISIGSYLDGLQPGTPVSPPEDPCIPPAQRPVPLPIPVSGIAESSRFIQGIDALIEYDEPTLILFPDAARLTKASDGRPDLDSMGFLQQYALGHCAKMQDRFCLFDLLPGDSLQEEVDGFRNSIGPENLSYGAAYHPWIYSSFEQSFSGEALNFVNAETGLPEDISTWDSSLTPEDLATLATGDVQLSHFSNNPVTSQILEAVKLKLQLLPPSAVIAAAIVVTDAKRGVWKAPANLSIQSILGPYREIDDHIQEDLNVHETGKAINALRTFPGRGTVIWGSRTLLSNSLEWRYVPVRRLFIYAEEFVKKATEPFVFETNDANTWLTLRNMIDSFLRSLWRQGAMYGATANEAYFIAIGLGESMTAQDILEGKLVVEIGLAAVRPAEFIVIRYACRMEEL